MKVLYIFPHPDDESFGVGQAMNKQRRDGHDVHLLTLTRGGATKQRHKYGYSIDEMGDVRAKEMLEVEKTLGLAGFTILDFPDSGLKECDPRELEAAIEKEIERVRPHVVVTYPVHGVSGFHDHLIAHGIVKRVFVELKDAVPELQRLAFSTVTESVAKKTTVFFISHSTDEEIDCVVSVDEEDIEACRRALDCYVTFQETIERTGIRDNLPHEVPFEFFRESFSPAVGDLFVGLE